MLVEYFSTYSYSVRALYITAVLVEDNLESWTFADELEYFGLGTNFHVKNQYHKNSDIILHLSNR